VIQAPFNNPLISLPGRQDSNLQPDRYEREDKGRLVDFVVFSSEIDRVRCVPEMPFLV
jgi:hypothetical protein